MDNYVVIYILSTVFFSVVAVIATYFYCRSFYKNKPNEWISCKARYPDDDRECLICDKDGEMAVGYWREDAKAWDSPNFGWLERDDHTDSDDGPCRLGKIVAWMERPEPFIDKS